MRHAWTTNAINSTTAILAFFSPHYQAPAVIEARLAEDLQPIAVAVLFALVIFVVRRVTRSREAVQPVLDERHGHYQQRDDVDPLPSCLEVHCRMPEVQPPEQVLARGHEKHLLDDCEPSGTTTTADVNPRSTFLHKVLV